MIQFLCILSNKICFNKFYLFIYYIIKISNFFFDNFISSFQIRIFFILGWFVSIQALVSMELVLIIVFLTCVTISNFNLWKRNRYFVTTLACNATVIGFIMLCALLIFIGNADSKYWVLYWMPNSEFNYYSWSYWAQLGATLLIFASCN